MIDPSGIGPAHRHPDSPSPCEGIRERVPQWTAAPTCSLGLFLGVEGFHHASTDLR